MTIKRTTSDSRAKARVRDRNQVKASFIIVSITMVFIGTFFFGLYYLNKAARNDISNVNTPIEDTIVDTVTPSPNQLVIVHQNQIVEVKKFGVKIQLLTHKRIDETTVESTAQVTLPSGQILPVQFSIIGEPMIIDGFTLRLVNATESAAQIVVQEN